MKRRSRAALALGTGVGLTLFALRGRIAESETVHALLRVDALALITVDFIGLNAIAADELFALAKVLPGTPLIDVEPEDVEVALAKHPRVADVRAARAFPNRLVVHIVERTPLARDAKTGLGLDGDAALFKLSAAEMASLPLVHGDRALAIPVLVAAKELGLSLAEVAPLRKGDARVRAAGHPQALRIGKDAALGLREWQRVLASGLVEETQAQEVDLRFPGNPVLRDFENSRTRE